VSGIRIVEPIEKVAMRFQIVFTYSCNMACQYCDRYVDSLPWPNTDITKEDLRLGLEVVKKSRVHIKQCRITGGEPKVHPSFEELAKYVLETWGDKGRIRTSVSTNMVLKNPRGLGVRWQKYPMAEKNHVPVMISPYDLGKHPVRGYTTYCRVQCRCGRLFDKFGFASCPYAGPIGRVLGIDPYQSMPVLYGRPDICRHCVHSLDRWDRLKIYKDALAGKIEFPTKTFREGLERFKAEPTEFKTFQERV